MFAVARPLRGLVRLQGAEPIVLKPSVEQEADVMIVADREATARSAQSSSLISIPSVCGKTIRSGVLVGTLVRHSEKS